jgi:UDP-N-acetylglucosamine 2-epimerase (non-hydrolysing)
LTAAKLNIGGTHRSRLFFDRTMPEEINRVLTDHLCDHYLPPKEAIETCAEGIEEAKIHFIGNTMIDSQTLLEQALLSRGGVLA